MSLYKIMLLAAWVLLPKPASIVHQYDTEIYVASYKGDKTCAVSYTFDDGLQEHYTQVYPFMEKLGIKGTFWVCGNIIEYEKNQLGKPRMTWEQMKEMSDAGHEISNHSWSHPNLQSLSTGEIKEEITKNDSIIFARIGKFPRTFCYPSNSFNEEVLRLASDNRVGTRTEQFAAGGEVSGATRESLDKWIRELETAGKWGVAMSHGISYGYDSFESPEIFWQHLEWVKTREDSIWIATFEQVATYVKARENIQLDIRKKGSEFIVTPRLDLPPPGCLPNR